MLKFLERYGGRLCPEVEHCNRPKKATIDFQSNMNSTKWFIYIYVCLKNETQKGQCTFPAELRFFASFSRIFIPSEPHFPFEYSSTLPPNLFREFTHEWISRYQYFLFPLYFWFRNTFSIWIWRSFLLQRYKKGTKDYLLRFFIEILLFINSLKTNEQTDKAVNLVVFGSKEKWRILIYFTTRYKSLSYIGIKEITVYLCSFDEIKRFFIDL